MSVLVTNASGAKGLIVTRALGRKGISVVNTDSERFAAAFFQDSLVAIFCLLPQKSIHLIIFQCF